MKKRNNTSLLNYQRTRDHLQSLQMSSPSIQNQNQDQYYQFSKPFHNQSYLSSILKNKFNNSSTIDTMPRRRQQHLTAQFQDTENKDPNNDFTYQLKRQIHFLKKKDASNRLQISKLNKQLEMLAQQYSVLQEQLRFKDQKIEKSNQYILRLDKQLRLFKDDVGKNSKTKSSTLYSKIHRLEQENQQMRFVIEEQLAQIQGLKSQIGNQDRYNIQQIVKNMKTYPNSQSERQQLPHPWEVTMNPNANQYQFETANKIHHHLSTINQDISYGNRQQETGRDPLYEMSSFHNFSDYSRSKFQLEQ